MYDFDDYNEREYYEPSEYDNVAIEFANKMKDILKKEVKTYYENIKNENYKLKNENKEIKQALTKREYELSRKEREIEEKEKSLEYDFLRKKFSELLKPFEEKYSGYYVGFTWAMIKKCKLCDEDRKITYKSPSGDEIKQNCSCQKNYRLYVPTHTVIETLNLYKSKDYYGREFGITPKYQSSEDDDCRWNKLEFTQFIDTFDESMASEYKGDILFKSKEECEKYCNWLNEKDKEK